MKTRIFRSRHPAHPLRKFTFATAAISALLSGAVSAQEASPPAPAAPGAAKAGKALITDRPDFTESAETVPKGMTQIEGGYTYTQNDGHDNTQSLGEILVRVAAGDKAEVRIGLNSDERFRGRDGQSYGFEGTDIGFKVRIKPGSESAGFHKAAVSAIGFVTLPNGTGPNSSNNLQGTAKLILGYSFNSRTDLGVNANYSYVDDGAARYSQLASSASLGYSLSERMGSYVEYYGFYPVNRETATNYVNTGLTYLINSNTQVDVRVGTGLGGPSDKSFIGTGVAIRF